MSLVHRSRKHHHHHAPNKIASLSANFLKALERVKQLEEEIARLGEGRKNPGLTQNIINQFK